MRLSPRTTRHAIDGGAPAAGRYLAAGDKLVPIMGTVTRLGRSLNADVEIDDPSVSRRHALIVRQDGRPTCSTTPAATAPGTTACASTASRSRDGDSFALGLSELRYVEVAETPTEPVELIAA